MATKPNLARRNLCLVELATDMDNVSRVCKPMGYSRHCSKESGGTSGPPARLGRSTGCSAPRGRSPTGSPRKSNKLSLITPFPVPTRARYGSPTN